MTKKRLPHVNLFNDAKKRAKKKNLEFNLSLQDIYIPEFCPIFGTKLELGKGIFQANSPSIDRIDNDIGYTKTNIIVISHKANTMKNNATMEEIKKIIEFYRKIENERMQ